MFFLTLVLLLNYLSVNGSLSRRGWFSHRSEMKLMLILTLWWTAGIGGVSCVDGNVNDSVSTGVGIVASWLAFFGSIFGTYKAYHALKEDEEYLDISGYESPLSDEEEALVPEQ